MALPGILRVEALVCGVFPETCVATPDGWRVAARLRPGQLVLTVGSGPLPLTAVEVQPPPLWVQDLPAGACGNRRPLRLPPGQPVLVETDAAIPLRDDPLALVPAEALNGWRGIGATPNVSAPLLLQLGVPDLVYAGPGLILAMPGPGGVPPDGVLPLAEARALVARLLAWDLGAGLAQATARGVAGG